MRRLLAALACAAALLAPALARAQYWDMSEPRLSRCCDMPGCLVLQTVMMGTFDAFDAGDSLTMRVYSAALDRLTAVTEEEMAHFCQSYDVSRATLWDCYCIALRNCLRADILLMPDGEGEEAALARTVLMVFLTPDEGGDAAAQRDAIRAIMGERELRLIAESAALPYDFVARVIEGE